MLVQSGSCAAEPRTEVSFLLIESEPKFVNLDELMQYIPVYVLYELAGLFADAEATCRLAIETQGLSAGKARLDNPTRERWLATFVKAKNTPQFVKFLPFATSTVDRLVDGLQSPDVTVWRVGELLRDLQHRIVDELRTQLHFQVEQSLEGLARKPYDGWEKSIAKHPSIKDDVGEASWCLAFTRATAAVFHLMRILELGLQNFAGDLGIAGMTQENWKNVIDQIEKKIREIEKEPKSADKSQRLQRYSEMANQFRYFKDAWRNHVAHAHSSYDMPQALSVYAHVRDFMQRLSVAV